MSDEEPSCTFESVISDDRKTFAIRLVSDVPMSDPEIFLALLAWIENEEKKARWKTEP